MCLAKLGKFKEACMHLLAKPNLLQYCAVDYLLNLFTCLSEKDPSLAVNSSSSFNNESTLNLSALYLYSFAMTPSRGSEATYQNRTVTVTS